MKKGLEKKLKDDKYSDFPEEEVPAFHLGPEFNPIYNIRRYIEEKAKKLLSYFKRE